jgi:hypothetical protein
MIGKRNCQILRFLLLTALGKTLGTETSVGNWIHSRSALEKTGDFYGSQRE